MSQSSTYGSMIMCERESIGSLNTIIVNKPKSSFASRTFAAFRPSRVKSVFGLFDKHGSLPAKDLKHQDGVTDSIGGMKVYFRYENSPPDVSVENARPAISRKKSLRSVKSVVARSLRSRRSSISPSKEAEVPKPISMSLRAKLAYRPKRNPASPVPATSTTSPEHTYEVAQYTRGINETEEMFRHRQQSQMTDDRSEVPFWSTLPSLSSEREVNTLPLVDRIPVISPTDSNLFYLEQDEAAEGHFELLGRQIPRTMYEAQKSGVHPFLDVVPKDPVLRGIPEAAVNLHNRKRARTVVGPRPTRLSEEDDPSDIKILTSKLTHSTPITIDHPRTSGLSTYADQTTNLEIEDSCFGPTLNPVLDDYQNRGCSTHSAPTISQESTRKEPTHKRSDSGYASLFPKFSVDKGERSLGLAEHQHLTAFLGEPAQSVSHEPSASIRCVSPDKGAPNFRSSTTSATKSQLDLHISFKLPPEKYLNVEAANAQHRRGNDTLKEYHGEGFLQSVATATLAACPPHDLENHLGEASHHMPSQLTQSPQTLPLIEMERHDIKSKTQIITTANGVVAVKWTRRADGSYEESGSSPMVSWSKPSPAMGDRTSSGTSSGSSQGRPSYSGRAWRRSEESWPSDTTVDDGDMGFAPAFAPLCRVERRRSLIAD